MKKNLLVFITLVFTLIQSNYSLAQSEYKEITLEDIWARYLFLPKLVNGIESMNDGKHFCVLERGNSIDEYSYEDGKKTRTIVSSDQMVPDGKDEGIRINSYTFSSDETKILIATETEQIYRHSSKSSFYIWDIAKKQILALSDGGKQRLATFSPDGSKMAFVRGNNLFIKDIVSNKEEQITNDGLDRHIINGTTDWVYEEEFAFTKALFWSPDGAKLAYYRFDESNVKEFWMTTWGDLYPEFYKFKYPKTGENNSLVTIHIYDLNTKTTKAADIGTEKDQYIPRILWTKSKDKLAILRMNRHQNKLEILLADANSGESKVIYTEENKYYIDVTDDYTFLNNQKHFLITSEKDGYNHIYLYDMDGNLVKQITKGNWDVVEFCGIDEDDEKIYYKSVESSFKNRDLYVIGVDGKGKTRLSKKVGDNDVEFSKTFDYYINTWSDANTPPVVTVNDNSGKIIREIQGNKEFAELVKQYNFTTCEFFDFKTEQGVELYGWMIKPPDFNKNNRYPVFMYFYGGPGDQKVVNTWGYFNFAWFQMLAQKGYIVVCVDNRGTGGRGEEFKKQTYLELGKLETIDQIEVAKYLGTLNYVDKDRIGVFGWSYGGYLSTLCMTKGADYFKAGIAVAPVTNWRYYDNIYTERFMRTPQENASGYDDNSPINFVSSLKGKYLLVHGTGDDNVHVQNSYDLVSALVNANKQFEMQFYPNKNHGIYGGYTRLHLYRRMTDFILDNL